MSMQSEGTSDTDDTYVKKQGKALNLKGGSRDETPLIIACTKQNIGGVSELLLSPNIDVNTGDIDDNTALHITAREGGTDILGLLVKKGSELDKVNNQGKTALHMSAQHGQIEVTKELLMYGANVNAEDKTGETPLSLAMMCAHGNDYDYRIVVKYLLENGANITDMVKQKMDSTTTEIKNIITEQKGASGQLLKSDTQPIIRKQTTEYSGLPPKPEISPKPPKKTTDATEQAVVRSQVPDVMQQLKEGPTITIDIGNNTSSTSNKINLICGYLQGSDTQQLTVTWYHNNTPVSSGQRHHVVTSIDLSSLILQDVRISDCGSYKCIVSSQYGQAVSEGNLSITESNTNRRIEEIPQQTLHKLNQNDFEKSVMEEFKTLKDSFDIIETKISDLDKSLETKIFESEEDVKRHVSTCANDITRNIRESAKNHVLYLESYTQHRLCNIKLSTQHNDFVNFRLFQNISKTVGSQVGLWRKLGEKLLQEMESYGNVIEDIDQLYTTEREKSFDVLIHWKIFTKTNDIQKLIAVLRELGLTEVGHDVNMAVKQYYKHKLIDLENFSDEGLCNLATEISNEWRTFGISLGVEDAQLDHLENDVPNDLTYRVTKMLITWNRKCIESDDCKLNKLREALGICGRTELVDILRL